MGENMKNIIQISGLTKEYSKRKVVDNLSLQAYPGDIVGLIGPNGAGKSTTMKIIMRLIRQTSGVIKIYGNEHKKNEYEVTQKIGFASESPSFYNYLTGYSNLQLMANLYPDVDKKRIDELVEFVGLRENINRKVKTYSTGMKQRLGLARALLNNPNLLILDEPTNGLDPRGMKDIYEILEKLAKERGIAILISSHQLHDIEKICNKIVMIDDGKMLFNGNIEELGGSLEESYFSLFREVKVC